LTDVLVVEEITILAVEAENTVLHEQVDVVEILAVAEQGPPGPPGQDGNLAGGALLVANRLSELASTPEIQHEAQSNLGLGVVDPLAYYILAKA
jgi:hypothetical protein